MAGKGRKLKRKRERKSPVFQPKPVCTKFSYVVCALLESLKQKSKKNRSKLLGLFLHAQSVFRSPVSSVFDLPKPYMESKKYFPEKDSRASFKLVNQKKVEKSNAPSS